MKRFGWILWMIVALISMNAGNIILGEESESADEILQKADNNQEPSSAVFDAKMIIHQPDRDDIKQLRLYSVGANKAYGNFSSPIRDKGTAILRIDDNMWLYLPSAEKTIKISGHMLRQSFMGSDFSYEDTTERYKLHGKYTASLQGTEKIGERNCYIILLTAKLADATYFQRKIWVEKERYVTLRQEMYAKSGKMLKIMFIDEVQQIANRYYATKIRMIDKLKKDSFTEMDLSDIELDIVIPNFVFTMGNLEKKTK